MALPGLQGYQGDSEISDSEGDLSPDHEPAPVPGAVISGIGLGIPLSNPIRTSPPPFTKPVVRSAPSITLVNYDRDDDDDMDQSVMEHEDATIESKVIICLTKPTVQRESTSPISLSQSQSPLSSPSSTSDEDVDTLFLPLDLVELPPAPEGVCPQSLQNKLIGLLETKRRLGKTPFDQIKTGKSFRNPSIYEKLIQLCGIDEFGTNYSKDIYTPNEWSEDDFYDKLSEAQKKAHEMKQRSRAERSKIEFKTGAKLPPQSNSGIIPTTSLQGDSSKRRSKWDVNTNNNSGGNRSTGSSPVKRTTLPVGTQALINARVISKSDVMKLINK